MNTEKNIAVHVQKPPSLSAVDAKLAVPRAQETTVRQVFRKALLFACFGYLAVLLLVTVSIWVGGDRWWWATALMFAPRWPWLVPGVLALPTLLFLRRSIYPSLLYGILILLLLRPELPVRPRAESAKMDYSLKVATLNVASGSVNTRLLAKAFPSHLDILFLQERGSSALRNIMPEHWNFSVGVAGVCLASRFPMVDVETLPRPEGQGWGDVAIRCVLQTDRGPVKIVAIHFESPRKGLEALLSHKLRGVDKMREVILWRRREAEAVSHWVKNWKAEHEIPLILAGDFNTPLESQNYRSYWSDYQNAFSVAGLGIGSTWFSSWHSIRIDHIFCDNNFKVLNCWVGDNVGSDHRPVFAEFVLPASNQSAPLQQAQ